MNSSMSIGFAPELVPLVKDGSKTLTYRVGRKYSFLEVGDKVKVRNSGSDEVFGEVEIVEKSKVLFKDLPIDRKGHEVYKSRDGQRETFRKYYGREVDDNEEILVLGFKVIKN